MGPDASKCHLLSLRETSDHGGLYWRHGSITTPWLTREVTQLFWDLYLFFV